MKFSRNNGLLIPQVQAISFLFNDIVIDSYSQYDIYFDGTSDGHILLPSSKIPIVSLKSGYVSYNSQNISTYNTGEPFSLSGWYNSSTGTYLYHDGIEMYFKGTGERVFELHIDCPNTNTLATDIYLNTPNISLQGSLNNFYLGGECTGALISDTSLVIFNGDTFFRNTFEKPIKSKSPIFFFLEANQSETMFFDDNDVSHQNNNLNGLLRLEPSWGPVDIDVDVNRVIPNSMFISITGSNVLTFGGDFDGIWSGNRFLYQDTESSLTLNYQIYACDQYGNAIDKDIFWFNVGRVSGTSNYVTGLTLTSSGEYLTPPTFKVSGYYYVTGIEQSLSSLLFSSGCSGNIPVTFNGMGFGANASGYLSTHPVLFQDLYTAGLQKYYLVDYYRGLNFGSGYTQRPIATINTGIYGSSCYDVPNFYNTNKAYFSKFNSLGTISASADFLTGIVLTATGLVSGGLKTGYRVTGVEITNIGSGYSNTLYPFISFVRNTGDTLTSNASGIFYLTSHSNTTPLSLDIKIEGDEWKDSSLFDARLTIPKDKNISFRYRASGIDNTSYMQVGLRLNYFDGVSAIPVIDDNVYFQHTFNTDPYALKKNDKVSPLTRFNTNSDLSFSLSQTELDSLYQGSSWSNNSFDIGDLDF